MIAHNTANNPTLETKHNKDMNTHTLTGHNYNINKSKVKYMSDGQFAFIAIKSSGVLGGDGVGKSCNLMQKRWNTLRL